MSKEELIQDINKHAPWYQCIDFPEYGITTTDNEQNIFKDNAYDSYLDGYSLEEATKLRPMPKWNNIKKFINMDDFKDQEILEIGSNCGFFSFEFNKLGAKNVTGLELKGSGCDHHYKCSLMALKYLKYTNVNFVGCDFMLYDRYKYQSSPGLLSCDNYSIHLPSNQFDTIFSSTVIDHSFFPIIYIYKTLKMARKVVYLDLVVCDEMFKDEYHKTIRLGVSEDPIKYPHHGYSFSLDSIIFILQRLGIKREDITYNKYGNGDHVLLRIDTTNLNRFLIGA